MGGNPERRVRPGDLLRVHHDTFNSQLDLLADWRRGRHDIRRPRLPAAPFTVRHFELKDPLDPLYQPWADAWPLDAQGEPVTDDPGRAFAVHDPLKQFRGRGHGQYGPPHDRGSLGLAYEGAYFLGGERKRGWVILQLQPHARQIRGTLTADVGVEAPTFTVDNVQVLGPTGAIIVQDDPGTAMELANVFGFAGDGGGLAFAQWRATAEVRWECYQMTCPAAGYPE